jgi:hypothetical protein
VVPLTGAGRKGQSRGSAAVHNQREEAARFTMPQDLDECELAMTVILKFYDSRNVCRIF